MKTNTRPSNRQGHISDPTGKLSGVKFFEAGKSGSVGPHGNRYIVSDFVKLLRWRHGFGPWNEAMLLSILDLVIPRHAQLQTAIPLDQALLRWVTDHMPQIIETHGAAWIEKRRAEVMSWKRGAFPTIDRIACKLQITADEVDGAGLCALRAFDNPKRQRITKRKAADKARKKQARARAGARPQEESIAARHRAGEFGSISLKTVRRRIKAGTINPDHRPSEAVSTFRPQQYEVRRGNRRKVDNHITRPDATAADNGTVRPIGGSISLRRVFIRLPQPRPTRDEDSGGRVPVRAG